MMGGGDADSFPFTAPLLHPYRGRPVGDTDTITDFAPGPGRILAPARLLPGPSRGPLDPGASRVGDGAGDEDDRFVLDAVGTLWIDPDGTGEAAAIAVARLAGAPALTAGNILIA